MSLWIVTYLSKKTIWTFLKNFSTLKNYKTYKIFIYPAAFKIYIVSKNVNIYLFILVTFILWNHRTVKFQSIYYCVISSSDIKQNCHLSNNSSYKLHLHEIERLLIKINVYNFKMWPKHDYHEFLRNANENITNARSLIGKFGWIVTTLSIFDLHRHT